MESASFLDKEQIAVIGERIDPVQLTLLLRKSVGHTELVSVGPVGPVEEKKPPKPPSTPSTNQKETMRCECVCREPYYCWQGVPLQVVQEVPSDTCSIL